MTDKQATQKLKTVEPTPSEQIFNTDGLKADLGARTARGSVIAVGSQGLRFVVGIVVTAVLARLLTPQDYGLVGMVAVVTGFVSMFKDLGLSHATIQRAEINNRQVSTLFWINVCVSLFIMLLTVAIAPLVARFFGEPRLTGITIVTATGFLFGGLTVQHEALLKRQMRFGALSAVGFAALTANILTTIILALRGAGYWALVLGQLALGVVGAIGAWVVCRWRPGWPGKYEEVRSLVAFGRNLTGFGIINYFARNLDNLLIGRVWGTVALGFYAKAYQLLLLPIDQINEPLTSVAVPALSRLTDSPERYRQAYLRLLEKVALVTMPGVALMIATSDWLVLIVLGPQWGATARIFALLGITGLFQPIANTTGWLLITQGRTHHQFQWGLIGGTIAIVAIVAGLPWGAVGVAASYACARVFLADPLLYWFVGRSGPVRMSDFYRAIAPVTCASLCALLATLAFRHWNTLNSPLLGLLVAAFITGATTLAVLFIIPAGRAALRDVKTSLFLLRGGKRQPLMQP
jgi:PST family polysaccharide transporter